MANAPILMKNSKDNVSICLCFRHTVFPYCFLSRVVVVDQYHCSAWLFGGWGVGGGEGGQDHAHQSTNWITVKILGHSSPQYSFYQSQIRSHSSPQYSYYQSQKYAVTAALNTHITSHTNTQSQQPSILILPVTQIRNHSSP